VNICFCVSSFPTVSQTFVTSQVMYAVAQGHQVTVACKTFEAETPLSDEEKALLTDVRIVVWPPTRPSLLQAIPRHLADRLAARMDRSAWRRQIDADVVIAHFGYRGAAVARAQKGWKHRPPLVTVFHGRDVSVEYQRDRLERYRDLFIQGDLHVTVNAQFAKRLVECGAPDARVETRHLGIPVSRYAYSAPKVDTTLRLFSLCRLVEKKGLKTAIDALVLLHQHHPEIGWRYDIGGDGPLTSELQDQVTRNGLQDRVRFLGALPHQDALKRITNSDVLLAPSCTAKDGDQEGIPVTLMEAMALGTPVCATRHSGIPELVTHHETGLLSDEYNAEELCQNILFLAQNPQNVRALATAARKRVEHDYNEDLQNAEFLERCRTLQSAPRTELASQIATS